MSMGQKSYSYFHRLVFMVSDFLIVNVSFILCYSVYALSGSPLTSQSGLKYLILFNLTWLISAGLMRLYTVKTFERIEDTYRQSGKTMLMQCLFFVVILLVMGNEEHEKRFCIVCYSILTLFIVISRFFL